MDRGRGSQIGLGVDDTVTIKRGSDDQVIHRFALCRVRTSCWGSDELAVHVFRGIPPLRSTATFATSVGHGLRVFEYRPRKVTASKVDFIPELIAPDRHRRSLSKKLCEAWDWRQPTGHGVLLALMLGLHRVGHIELPPVRCRPHTPLAKRSKPVPVDVDFIPVHAHPAGTRATDHPTGAPHDEEPFLGSLIEMHHYLGYTNRWASTSSTWSTRKGVR